MNNRQKLIIPALCAALLLSGCNTDKPATTAPENDTTTSAAETTTTEGTTTSVTTTAADINGTPAAVTTTTKVDALSGEEDSRAEQSSGKTGDIMQLTLNQLIGKRITCDNKKSLHMYGVDDWQIETNEVPYTYTYSDEIWFEFPSGENRFSPSARYSSGVMSAECDKAFKEAVDSAATAYYYGNYDGDEFWPDSTIMTVDHVEDDGAVFMSEIKYGYKTACYDKMYTVNAFVRYAPERNDEWNTYYEFIIDPVYMNRLGFPMTEYDPEKMKFNVNGTEFYADTTRGYASPVTYLIDGPSVSAHQNTDFIYAKIVLMGPSFCYNNNDGALADARIMYIEPITEDTDSIIKNGYTPECSGYGICQAIEKARDEIIGENTLGLWFVDLDHDGMPEIVTQYCDDPDELEGPYAPARYKVFAYTGDIEYIGGFTANADDHTLREAVYLPTGEHGWHIKEYKDHCLLTLKNGKLDIKRISEQRPVGEKNEYGYYDEYDYYYLGEKIVLEAYETKNPLTREPRTYYKWVSDNSLGYSVMGDNPYTVYYMLYDSLNDDFHTKSYVDLTTKISYYGSDTWETKKFAQTFTPSAQFPGDIFEVYMRSEESKTYEDFYNVSYEGAKEKPVIYLYPEEQTDVSVRVNFPFGGELTCTYPEYNNGWSVTAMPDGTLYDENGDEYYCLYWEGRSADIMNDSKGFCVAGKDTAEFLREKLMYIGLTAREANEFIIYWLPKMQDNAYNIITLHTDDYAASVPLTVSPMPDTQIRVFMTYRPSEKPVDIPEQELQHYERNGFTLVEWGGSAVERYAEL
ncbi:MAG: hypothetical protein K5876_01010 [Ruminiclostridium sp.]|nr:hypothetical protein [Ruminiclostridium sp.]